MRVLSRAAGAVGKLAARAQQGRRGSHRRLLHLAVLAIMIMTLCTGDRGLFRLAGLVIDRAALSSEILGLEARRAQMRKELEQYAGDSATIERVARERLDLIKPGETVYKFPPGE